MIKQTRYAVVAASLGLLAPGALLIGCPAKANYAEDTIPKPAPLTTTEKEQQSKLKANGISSGEIDFAFHLLQKTAAKTPTGNAFLSPFSASQAVLLAANGSTGATQAGFLKAVGLPAGDIKTVNGNQKALLSLLQPAMDKGPDNKETPSYEWTVANAIWSRYPPKPAYVKTSADYLGATAEPLTTAAAINSWADKNTRGRIKDIVTEQDVKSADLVLTNAVYFKGRWAHPFSTDMTHNEPFHLPGGTVRQQPFLHDTFNYMQWYAGKNYEAVTIPYIGGMSLVVILPAKDTTAQKVLGSLTATEWNAMRKGMQSSRIALSLPKFEFNYGTSLLKPLTELGMPTDGDFSPVSDKLAKSHINDVIQKTFVRVDEKGTEAAAVTGIAVAGAAAPVRTPPRPFVVDRPFLCAIVHDDTGAIVFTGVINNPEPLK